MTKNSPLKYIYWPFLKLRAKNIVNLLNHHIKIKENILDIGCGNMIISQELVNNKQIQIKGIDVLDMNLTELPFQLFNGKKIPFPSKYFDTSLLIGVLHHVKDQKTLLVETKRVSQKIIIFEDIYLNNLERFWIKVKDIIGNLPEEPKMNFALNFHSDSDWSHIFAAHRLHLLYKKILWNPFRFTHHAIYVLNV